MRFALVITIAMSDPAASHSNSPGLTLFWVVALPLTVGAIAFCTYVLWRLGIEDEAKAARSRDGRMLTNTSLQSTTGGRSRGAALFRFAIAALVAMFICGVLFVYFENEPGSPSLFQIDEPRGWVVGIGWSILTIALYKLIRQQEETR